ncbi:MAG TPA: carboxypeptidase-like regulatory domain-containing protein, partial [Thermoanaerobaculia bacterium]
MISTRPALRVIVLLCTFGGAAAAATTGALVDRNGRPVSGATIRALPFETEDAVKRRIATAAAEPEPLATATSDARGRFSLEVDSAYFRIAVDAKGFAPLVDQAEKNEFVGTLLLEPADLVTFKLEGDGEPVSGAFVRAGTRELRSDANGTVVVAVPKSGGGSIWIVHPAWAPVLKTFRRASELPNTIAMTRGIAVRGAVETPAGEPVPAATIEIDGVPAATSGDDGTFVVAQAPSGWRELTARRGDEIGMATRRPGVAWYRIRLADGASISGTVLDAKTKAPLAGVPVTAMDDRPGDPRGPSFLAGQPDALTDAKGRFRIGPLGSGSHRLFASRIGYEFSFMVVEVRSGERAEKTIGGQRLARISGTVVDEERRPIGAA